MARSIEDAASLDELCEPRRRLGLCGNRMKNVCTANAAPADEGSQAARYRFDFGKFRHLRSTVAENPSKLHCEIRSLFEPDENGSF